MSTQPSDLEGLTLLGNDSEPSKKLEAFPNRSPDRYYLVSLETNEFTNMCPATGQPDFATIQIEYVPDEKIVESKSLKLYFWSYRNEGVFHEHVVNVILDDLVEFFKRKTPAVNDRGEVALEFPDEIITDEILKTTLSDEGARG